MPRVVLPETGVWIVEGIPGSGKSFFLVRELVRLITQERRPVYTNLPLVWPVMREYLRRRGNDRRCANLVYELREEHFRAFCRRQTVRASWLAAKKKLRRPGVRAPTADELEADWVAEHGPDVVHQVLDRDGEPQGPPANWIPGGAVIIIDEVQEWFPQQTQREQDLLVQGYITKHRHHQHLVIVASQDRMQVSIAFRRNCSRFVLVRNKGDDRLAWGIRFRHIGLRAIGYSVYTGDQVAARALEVEPIANYVVLTSLPWERVLFKLYRSFTHAAGAERLRRDLLRSRVEAGLGGDQQEQKEQPVRSATRKFVLAAMRFVGRWFARIAVVGIVGVVAYAVGSRGSVAGDKGGTNEAEKLVWPKWTATGEDWVRLDGQRVRVDSVHAGTGARLVHVSRSPRVLLFDRGGVCYAWRHGEAEPERLGEWREIARALYAVKARELEGAGESAGGTLGQ